MYFPFHLFSILYYLWKFKTLKIIVSATEWNEKRNETSRYMLYRKSLTVAFDLFRSSTNSRADASCRDVIIVVSDVRDNACHTPAGRLLRLRLGSDKLYIRAVLSFTYAHSACWLHLEIHTVLSAVRIRPTDVCRQESCAIAKMTARCADKSKQTVTMPHLHLRSRDSRLTQFNRTLWT